MSFRTLLLTVASLSLLTPTAHAITVQSVGAGSAVTHANRIATFDAINASGIDLSGYTEGGLSISVNDTSFLADPAIEYIFNFQRPHGYFYGDGGNSHYVTIKAVDDRLIYGLEFLYGDGYSVGSMVNTAWETWRDGALVGSGSGVFNKNSIVGWSDTDGFDELRVAAGFGLTDLGNFQALGMDNLRVDLGDLSPDLVINEPVRTPDVTSTAALLAVAAMLLPLARRVRAV